ncbi:hypothetical protein JMJ77_0006856, partial [Colletotrichum scovillei]
MRNSPQDQHVVTMTWRRENFFSSPATLCQRSNPRYLPLCHISGYRPPSAKDDRIPSLPLRQAPKTQSS